MKDIKEKQVSKEMKLLDRKQGFSHFVREASVSTKEQSKELSRRDDSRSGGQQATDKVIQMEKRLARDGVYKGKRLAIKQRKKHQLKKNINTRNASTKINEGKEKLLNKSIKQSKNKSSNKFKTNNSYQNHMRMSYMKKQQKAMKEKSYQVTKKGTSIVKGVSNGIKSMTVKFVSSLNKILGGGGFVVIIIIVILFFGVFAALAGDSTINSATEPIAPEVYEHSELVEKYAKKHGIFEYKNLIYAVMMQESGGVGGDPMQSSECEYNTKYPKQPNGITNVEYSIDVGILYLADCLQLAEVQDAVDMSRISLALQGYNYGKGYITWAQEHFKGYTKANAKVYSDEMKRELGVSVYGDPEYVEHVLRYYHLGNGNLVQIAQSQVGNVGGKIYWSWYGYTSRVEWCACFVSWVANEAGLIQQGMFPKFSNCEEGIRWFKEHNQWKEKGTTPEPGYIIFFDWDDDGISDHVGIVEKVEKNIIYTIEGNSINDECRKRSYLISSSYIVGFGFREHS